MAQSGGCARHIHRHVTATNDQHLLAQVQVVAAQVDVDQEIHRPQHPIELLAFDIQVAALIGADGDKNGVEIPPQVLQAKVGAQNLVEFQLGSQGEDGLYFQLDQLARQAIFGNPQAQHPTRHRSSLEDGHSMAQQRQVVSTGEARRASPNHRHLLARVFAPLVGGCQPAAAGGENCIPQVEGVCAPNVSGPGRRLLRFAALPQVNPIAVVDEALERTNGNRGIYFPAPAGGLARRAADPTTCRGEGVGLACDQVRALIFLTRNGRNVSAPVGSHRAGELASHVPLVEF